MNRNVAANVAAVLGLLVAGMGPALAQDPQPDAVAPSNLPDLPVAPVMVATNGPGVAESGSLRVPPRRLRDYNLAGCEQLVNLTTLDPWDVVQLIEFLANRGGLNNIVISKGVAGLTTKLKFSDVAVCDALEIVLSVNQLAYEVRNDVLTIMTDQEYQALNGASFYDYKKVRMVDLHYADPAHVATMITPLKSSIGTVVSDPVTGSLILIDTADKIREMVAIIEKADLPTVSRVIPTETRTFSLNYAAPEDIQAQVQTMLSKEVGAIRVDARTKTIMVTDLPHNLRKIEEVIAAFDVARRQVFIEAKIVTVLLDDLFKLGINWDHLFDGLDPRVQIQSAVNRTTLVKQGDGVGSLSYKTVLLGGDLNIVLDALKTVGETRILSNPHVAVMADEEATIKVIREEPYAEAQIESGTTNVVGETIKFIEVGVTLAVTPRINADGWISMAIKPEISDVVSQYQAFRTVPVVQRAFAETTVMVRDRETLIIGGMIQNRHITNRASVPLLGRLPLIGVLFRSTSEQYRTEETVTFLTPQIITGDQPITYSRDLGRQLKPLRSVGKEQKGP